MQIRTCTKCKIEKPISEYRKSKLGKFGTRADCKLCEKEYKKNNKEKIKKGNQEYYKKNKEQITIKMKEYNEKNKERRKEYKKAYDIKKKKKNNKYKRERLKNNIQYKIIRRIRSRLKHFLVERKIYKNNKTILSIGCSKEHLTDWIKYNIDLDNLNEYHIDHVIPLASFNCKTYEEVIETKCNHWTNLMPTSPEYNLIKSDREPTKHELFKQELRIKLFKLNIL